MAKLAINAELCKACGYCIIQCPKKVLDFSGEVNKKGYRYACAARPDDCTGCMVCATICPDCAIEIYK